MPDSSALALRRDGIEKIVPAQVEFTPRLLAEVFADMSDESQAQFFIDLAEIAYGGGQSGHIKVPATASPEPCLTAQVERHYGWRNSMAAVWLAYGSTGYRISLPNDLAFRLMEALSE